MNHNAQTTVKRPYTAKYKLTYEDHTEKIVEDEGVKTSVRIAVGHTDIVVAGV